MAEDNAAAKQAQGGGSPGGKPVLLYALVLINMVVVAGVGAMLYMGRQKDVENAKAVDKVAQGIVQEAQGEAVDAEKEAAEDFVGRMIPLETFLINLSGHRGSKVLKVNMELEVEGEGIANEIDKRKPQIRDIIIILLSSKTYAQLSTIEGKEFLREEIRDTVNSFLTKGRVKRVHFTEFIYN